MEGLREAIYGMPELPLDEGKYFIAGCTTEGPKYICVSCGWGKDQITEWMTDEIALSQIQIPSIENKYVQGQVLYIREGGSKIILDSINGEGLNIEVYAHVVDADGKEYKTELLENITKFGYWEWVGDQESDDFGKCN